MTRPSLHRLIATAVASAAVAGHTVPSLAQPVESSGEVIDILVPVLTPEEQAQREECERLVAAGRDRGEIVVCAEDLQSSEFFYSGNAENAQDRHARETMNRGNPATPDPCGPQCGIFTGPPTVRGLCGFIFNPCPPPAALIIDFAALPEPPAGSDAERVSQGLSPRNDEDASAQERASYEQEQLGLPDPTGSDANPR